MVRRSSSSSFGFVATVTTVVAFISLLPGNGLGTTPKANRLRVHKLYARTLHRQGVLIDARCPDNADDLADETHRNMLSTHHLRQHVTSPGGNVIRQPQPHDLSADVWPGGAGVLLGTFQPQYHTVARLPEVT